MQQRLLPSPPVTFLSPLPLLSTRRTRALAGTGALLHHLAATGATTAAPLLSAQDLVVQPPPPLFSPLKISPTRGPRPVATAGSPGPGSSSPMAAGLTLNLNWAGDLPGGGGQDGARARPWPAARTSARPQQRGRSPDYGGRDWTQDRPWRSGLGTDVCPWRLPSTRCCSKFF